MNRYITKSVISWLDLGTSTFSFNESLRNALQKRVKRKIDSLTVQLGDLFQLIRQL